MDKKQWERPKLLVLVRAKPEESVLASCKDGESGRGASAAGCYQPDRVTPCTAQTAS